MRLPDGEPFDEVYQLAPDTGGGGFIHSAECETMRNSALINVHLAHAAANSGAGRYLLSSSACVYRDMKPDEAELGEDDANPVMPDNEYRWEKNRTPSDAAARGNQTHGAPWESDRGSANPEPHSVRSMR